MFKNFARMFLGAICIAALASIASTASAKQTSSSIRALGLGFTVPQINGKSNVSNPMTGELVYDSSDSTFWGYASSSWIALGGGGGSSVPTGTIQAFAGTDLPAGYMWCDGRALNRVTESALFDVIAESFGAGDGTNTFNVPDLRGRFLRGVDGGAGRDPNAATRTAMATGGATGDAVGSVQSDALQGHSHQYSAAGSGGASGGDYLKNGTPNTTATAIGGPVTDGVNGTPRVSSETRPTNASVNYIIKL